MGVDSNHDSVLKGKAVPGSKRGKCPVKRFGKWNVERENGQSESGTIREGKWFKWRKRKGGKAVKL